MREAVVRALTGDGHVVAAFANAREPEAILRGAPDLAILDVLLPGGRPATAWPPTQAEPT